MKTNHGRKFYKNINKFGRENVTTKTTTCSTWLLENLHKTTATIKQKTC